MARLYSEKQTPQFIAINARIMLARTHIMTHTRRSSYTCSNADKKRFIHRQLALTPFVLLLFSSQLSFIYERHEQYSRFVLRNEVSLNFNRFRSPDELRYYDFPINSSQGFQVFRMPGYIFNKYKTYVYVYKDIIYAKMNFYPYGLHWVVRLSSILY